MHMCAQVQALRSAGEFPQLIWKDTAPQHFKTTFGEYPEDKPKPPFECAPVGKDMPPQVGHENVSTILLHRVYRDDIRVHGPL